MANPLTYELEVIQRGVEPGTGPVLHASTPYGPFAVGGKVTFNGTAHGSYTIKSIEHIIGGNNQRTRLFVS